ncbi:tail fiber protein [Paenibacillus sp. MER 99-2]|uniref:phage tail protein n=1 Tax=Paenibacillus sp. MER 99-2 TaxID=2939572 RepID=UPI00203B39D4|nr:tail fiber protein [Paenibacillus sp. MER 99-2]MCM3175033.1 tail fiber protein [Paenibacillus sp. MER 99-2]
MDPYVGEIRLYAGKYAPLDWAFCHGQMLMVTENSLLFSVIGNKYGGDGQLNFQLPDLRGRVPMHWGEGAGLTPQVLGKSGGLDKVALLETQMPNHTHTTSAQSTGNTVNPQGAIWATTPKDGKKLGPSVYSKTPSVSMNLLAIEATGGSQPHNNIQPYTELNFIIALQGVYPAKQ